ncbi:Cro/CI family transcriptional regulator [Pseudomonas alliivorans]|nr:Cro/CI family transcriptional regulator [Pseudomonas alliivorans]
MNRIPLTEFVENHGQDKAAQYLGLSQGGISKALRADRQVFVLILADGAYRAEEIKPFPAQAMRKKSAA